MYRKSVRKRDLAAAQRGLIVQRVLVDRWTLAEAGAPFGIDERRVARLVAAYRRHGMAALRGKAGVGWPRWCELCLGWISPRRRGDATTIEPVARWARGAPGEPARRWRWN